MAASPLRAAVLSDPGPAPERVAVLLPPGEGFSPDAVGAVGLLVQRLNGRGELVIGRVPEGLPFPDRRFAGIRAGRMPAGRRLGYVRAAAAAIRAARPALLEVHNRPELAAMLGRRFPDLPVLLVLHNDPLAMRRANSVAARRSLLRRMRVATVSGFLRDRFLLGLAPALAERVTVLPNCLDLAAVPAGMAREPTVLFAGRITADKGADGFVRGWAMARPALGAEWRAEMIGGDRFRADAADTPFMRALRPEAAAAGIALPGHRPHGAVLDAMARAAIVVVPSRWEEPFGLAALEAMACGAALLCAPRGGMAALVDGVAIAVDPDRPAELAAAILRLARDPALRATLGRAGRERAAAYGLPAARERLDAARAAAVRS